MNTRPAKAGGVFTILQQRDMMVQEYGLDGYRRPSGRYPQL
jgi:hypothetical protein